MGRHSINIIKAKNPETTLNQMALIVVCTFAVITGTELEAPIEPAFAILFDDRFLFCLSQPSLIIEGVCGIRP